MTKTRKEQITTLRAYWSTYSYSATGSVTSTNLPLGIFAAATITKISGGDPSVPTRGIVTTNSGGFVKLRLASDGSLLTSSSSPIFGRLTESGGTYTVNYKILNSGSESSVSIPAGSYTIQMLFPEVMQNDEVPAGANITVEDSSSLGSAGLPASPSFTSLQITSLSTGVVHSNSSGNLSSSTVVNADVSNSAAIDGTKISPNFGSQTITTTGGASLGSSQITSLSTGVIHSDVSGNLSSSTLVNADVSNSAAIDGTKISPNFGSQTITTTGNASLGASVTSGGAKIFKVPVTEYVYGIAGLHQTSALSDEKGAIPLNPSIHFAGDAAITRTFSFVAVLECSAAGQSCQLELFNLSDGITVKSLSTTNTFPTLVSTSLILTTDLPNSSKLYVLRLKRISGTNADLVGCKMARIEISYS